MRPLLSIFFIIYLSICQAQISKQEKKIIRAVDDNEPQARAQLIACVDINSGTLNFEGVEKVAKIYQASFDELGMRTEWISGDAFNRAGHLLAKKEGSGPKILMIGHLDTVFEPESPFQKHEMINDSIMKGPGVIDMKGGNTIIWLTLKALKEAGVWDDLSIEIMLTGDEEKVGLSTSLARKDLVEAADWADIALGFENGDGDPKTIVVSRRGSQQWKLFVSGQSAHSSQIFTETVGAGAIYESARILTAFYNEFSKETYLTSNPGLILGGTDAKLSNMGYSGEASGKDNVVAQTVIIAGDLRAISLEQEAEAKAKMLEIVANNLPHTTAKLEFQVGSYPPLSPSKGNRQLLLYYNTVSQDLGLGPVAPVNPRNAGAADISFSAGHVQMAVDGLGLSGDHGHTENEYGNLNQIARQAKRAALLIYRLSSGKYIID